MISIIILINTNTDSNSNNLSRSFENDIFNRIVIDGDGPVESWAKNIGDINGDGLNDIIVGGHGRKRNSYLDKVLIKLRLKSDLGLFTGLVWYENPTWEKHIITQEYSVRTDVEISDINNDGLNDIVFLSNQGLIWLKNPDWQPVKLSELKFHDIEVYDLDGDGNKEIIARNQSLFGYNNGDRVYIFTKSSDDSWNVKIIPVLHGEGLLVKDLNEDGYADIIVNKVWLRNPGNNTSKRWETLVYAENWQWSDVKIQVADMNGDQLEDIILAPAEPVNGKYHISWFESKVIDSTLSWKEHVVISNVETAYHSLATNDFDNDGDIDILTAKMNQGETAHVLVYLNAGEGKEWTEQLIDTGGLHNIVASDIDGDYDIDFIGTNWQLVDRNKSYPVSLWLNKTNNKTWQKVTIDNSLPINRVFVFTSDIDNDGDKDVLTGNYIFKNSGKPYYNFTREKLSRYDSNISQVYDYDNDGDNDLLISKWQGYNKHYGIIDKILFKLGIEDREELRGNKFFVALNNGSGVFNSIEVLPDAEGDLLQGTNIINIDGSKRIILSWHKSGFGIQAYKISGSIDDNKWSWSILSKISQDEDLSVADIDLDGDEDILLGTKWLRNEGENLFKPFDLYDTQDKPDRNFLKDINNDNKIDAIIGYEAISKLGKVAWYEQGSSPTAIWNEHVIANIIGPMSLDVGDIDLDGDMDIVAGEHNLKFPELSRVFVFYNNLNKGREWGVSVVNIGDEHHDGTQLFDYDNDGDLDIISIGWTSRSLNLYINPLN
ncbi:MAG: VCBS repeat-containing protein [Pseudomonadota bacterium]